MNKFDFSIYDIEDVTPIQKNQVTPQIEEKARKTFDFDMYDSATSSSIEQEVVPSAKNDQIYQQYATAPKSAEDLKKMSVKEKMAYAEDLKTEREYLRSAGFTKGALSGATLGATEHIEALKPQEHELGAGFGEFTGAALPITGIAKAVSIPIKYATKGLISSPRALNAVSKLMTAFGTGTTYSTGKQAIKGEGIDPVESIKTGALFASVDALFQGGSKAINWLSKLSPKQQASILEQGIIPSDLPKSQYSTAEEVLRLIRQEKPKLPGELPPPPPPPGGAAPSITRERITPPQDIGLRPTPTPKKDVLADQVGDIFSKNRFYNTTQGGQAFKNEIMNLDEDVYRGVNELYRISRELNENVLEIHPQLAQRLTNRITELEAIPEPSDVQRRVIRTAENIVKSLGGEAGYTPISNQVLIDQIQSLRQIIDYDFAHGDTKNIFRPLINDIQDSVIRASENSGNSAAADAFSDARSAYRSWVEAFDNPYVRPFRDGSNQDFSKLFKSALDMDESNMLSKILNLSERGQQLTNASKREIVEKHLSKFMENPRSANEREFNKALRELEAVITPEQTAQIKEEFANASRRPNIRAKIQPKKVTNDEQIAAKYLKSEPEDIQSMMNKRSGIKELREDLSDTPTKREVFDRLSKQKMRSILREGNIEKEFTGDDLYKFLNKEKNYEIFSELLGDEEAEALRLAAKDIGKAQVKSESRKKLIKKEVTKAAALKAIGIVLSVL